MPDVTRLLDAAAAGDPTAAAELLPIVYDELRRLAAARMSQESPGHCRGTRDRELLTHRAEHLSGMSWARALTLTGLVLDRGRNR